MPKEFQEKKCTELKESLFSTFREILNDFIENYNHAMEIEDES